MVLIIVGILKKSIPLLGKSPIREIPTKSNYQINKEHENNQLKISWF